MDPFVALLLIGGVIFAVGAVFYYIAMAIREVFLFCKNFYRMHRRVAYLLLFLISQLLFYWLFEDYIYFIKGIFDFGTSVLKAFYMFIKSYYLNVLILVLMALIVLFINKIIWLDKRRKERRELFNSSFKKSMQDLERKYLSENLHSINSHELKCLWKAYRNNLEREIIVTDDVKKVLLLGEFSTGKSAFINMLLGVNILPERLGSTDMPIVCIKGTDYSGIWLKEIAEKNPTPLGNFENIPDNWDKFEHVSITLTGHPLLKNGLTIWDTPGINSTNPSHSKHLDDFLTQHITDFSDIFYFVNGNLTNSTLRFIKEHKHVYKNMTVVQNMRDNIDTKDFKLISTNNNKIIKEIDQNIKFIALNLYATKVCFEDMAEAKRIDFSDFDTILRWKELFIDTTLLVSKTSDDISFVKQLYTFGDKPNRYTVDILHAKSEKLETLEKCDFNVVQLEKAEREMDTVNFSAVSSHYNKITNGSNIEVLWGEFIMDLYFGRTDKANGKMKLLLNDKNSFFSLLFKTAVSMESNSLRKLIPDEQQRQVVLAVLAKLTRLQFDLASLLNICSLISENKTNQTFKAKILFQVCHQKNDFSMINKYLSSFSSEENEEINEINALLQYHQYGIKAVKKVKHLLNIEKNVLPITNN